MPLINIVVILIVCWGLALAREPLHPHAGHYQIHPQRRGGHRRRSLAPRRLRAISFLLSHPRRG